VSAGVDDNKSLLALMGGQPTHLVLDSQQLQVQSAHRLAKSTDHQAEVLIAFRLPFKACQLSLEEGVGIRHAGCNKNLIVFVLKSVMEGEHKAFLLLFDPVFLPGSFVVIGHSVSSRLPVLTCLSAAYVGSHSSLKE
jgi:hypothetical protein